MVMKYRFREGSKGVLTAGPVNKVPEGDHKVYVEALNDSGGMGISFGCTESYAVLQGWVQTHWTPVDAVSAILSCLASSSSLDILLGSEGDGQA